MIDSVTPELSREVPDPWTEDSWLAARDPSGELRRGMEELGAFEGGFYVNGSGLRLFTERLRAAGDTVTYVTLTDSTHTDQSQEDLETLVDAVVPDAQP